jgi:hypothetical protein
MTKNQINFLGKTKNPDFMCDHPSFITKKAPLGGNAFIGCL